MRTENNSALLLRILALLRPSDLLLNEHRATVGERIETLRREKGWDKLQFGQYIRTELNELCDWLAGTRELTAEFLTEICGLLYISLGDLVLE